MEKMETFTNYRRATQIICCSEQRRQGEYWKASQQHVVDLLRNSCHYTRFTEVRVSQQHAVDLLKDSCHETRLIEKKVSHKQVVNLFKDICN